MLLSRHTDFKIEQATQIRHHVKFDQIQFPTSFSSRALTGSEEANIGTGLDPSEGAGAPLAAMLGSQQRLLLLLAECLNTFSCVARPDP
jgi:hypothetical protein